MFQALGESSVGVVGRDDGVSPGQTSARNEVITIAHLIGCWGIGGLEGQLAQVVNRLPAERFRHVIIFRNGRNVMGPPVRDGVEIICLDDPARNRRWALRLAKLLRELRVSVVHNRELFTVSDTVAACRLAGIPRMAFSFHGFTDALSSPRGTTRWLWRRALHRYQARWAVSDSAREAVTKAFGLPAESFSVLLNGVDSVRFCPEQAPGRLRRRLGLPLGRVVLLAVGNVTEVKNHRLIIEGIAAVGLQAASYTLVIVGEDRLAGQTQHWAAANLPGHDVRLPGATENVLDWYRAADLFVLPSRSEGLCNALLEAMACGLGVVATDVPGNREVLHHGETGLLVPLGEAAAFGVALRRLVEDAELRRRIGQAARRYVIENHDINRTVEAYGCAYEGLR
ncbi:MAG: glycosyltransferase [Phycisphaerae bacterium]|nr:glycosyltransferase [Phycisphaerae bacterium]